MLIVSQDGNQVVGVNEDNLKLYVNDCDVIIDDLPFSFGTYLSHEKALEVVEVICKLIRDNSLFDDYKKINPAGGGGYRKCSIFRMPDKNSVVSDSIWDIGISVNGDIVRMNS